MIPPLTVQPLVENSIQHGLKDRISGGKVDILITEKRDHMEVVVADNGVGFPAADGKAAGKDGADKDGLADKGQGDGRRETGIKEHPASSRTSIGLNNVRERLEFFYRRSDVLQIERIDGITKITLKLYKIDG